MTDDVRDLDTEVELLDAILDAPTTFSSRVVVRLSSGGVTLDVPIDAVAAEAGGALLVIGVTVPEGPA